MNRSPSKTFGHQSDSVAKLADWFVKQVREDGLVDVKFFPTTDSSVTVEDAAAAMLEAMRQDF